MYTITRKRRKFEDIIFSNIRMKPTCRLEWISLECKRNIPCTQVCNNYSFSPLDRGVKKKQTTLSSSGSFYSLNGYIIAKALARSNLGCRISSMAKILSMPMDVYNAYAYTHCVYYIISFPEKERVPNLLLHLSAKYCNTYCSVYYKEKRAV